MSRVAWRGASWWPLALALAPFVVLALYHWGWSPASSSGDYAQYILHARALVERTGYADIGYLYHPEAADIGPRMYPPGLPLLLAPLVAIGGVDSPLLHVFSVACIMLFGVLAWVRLRQSLSPSIAACGVAIALLGMEGMLASLVPMSDLPFCAALWLLFVMVDAPGATMGPGVGNRESGIGKEEAFEANDARSPESRRLPIPDFRLTALRGSWTNQRTIAVTVLGFALIGTRLAGVAIVPALGIYWLVHRRTLGVRPLLPVIAWGAAGVVGLAAGLVGNPYANVLSATGFNAAERLAALVHNYRYALLDSALYPLPGDRANEWYHLVATPVILVGAVGVIRRLGASFLTCVMVAYAALLLTVRIGEARYLWPVIPLLGASLAQGLASIALAVRGRAGSSGSHVVPRVAIVVPALVVIGALVRQLALAPPFAVSGTPDARALYSWLAAEQARGPVRAMFHNPRVLTLESGVPAMGILPRTAPGLVSAMQDRRISHLVWQRPDVSSCLQRIADTLPTLYPDRFVLAFENATFRVYRRRPEAPVVTGPVEYVDWRTPERYCPPI